jgi:predicted regulator of Ras-like GTPase activity (Roadblock/LC7/MglB family)
MCVRGQGATVSQLRVVLESMPPMLAGIVHDVAVSIPGAVVTDAVAPDQLAAVVAEMHPDVAVIHDTAANPLPSRRIETLLCGGGRPVRIVVLSPDGRDARLLVLEQNVTDLVDISAEALRKAISQGLARHG